MRWLLCVVFLALPAVLAAAPDALDIGLQAMGQTRETFRLDSEALITRDGGPYRLPLFTQWFGHPLRIPFWERHLRDGLLNNSGKVHALINNTGLAINQAPRRDLIPPTPAEQYRKRAEAPNALAQAIRALDPSARVPATTQVPPRAQQMAAALLFASADALHWRAMALRRISGKDVPTLYAAVASPIARRTTAKGSDEEDEPFPAGYAEHYQQQDLLAQVDLALFLSAADDLTAVLDDVIGELQKTPVTETFAFACKTRYGEIRLSGGTDDTYDVKTHHLLILDMGGHDTYHTGGASGGAQYPIGILVDAAGDDRYDAQGEAPSFGTGVLGWGLLADLAGNDRYTAKGFYSQGCGLVGVGVLFDALGNDTYNALGGAQGMGNFGIGILSDGAGDDTYDTYCYGQGCGLTMACGLLLDTAGNDRYTANDTDIAFPSAQSKEHNVSMCQGAGTGMRRDYLDNHSLSGGIGMLLDAKGDDKYFGGVFSQAVGYWYGIGILDDRTGNDSYRGVWYAQSATAHFGISYQNDGSGDDLYTVTNCVSNGSGHDYSVSLFVEESGNDTYDMRGSALGQGLNCGLGLFVDIAGNDNYKAAYSTAYGQSINFSATGLRSEIPTYGLFLDLQGNDSYPAGPMGNAKSWLQKTEKLIPVYYGAGLDLEAQTVRWDGS